ncbi:MAG: hypothetical protein DRG20_00015 [Deltaproteobacteria bacterium]|nr:radical SAM protein [Deltaproteobacteria bacterium]RLA91856.1 MAG: hypothetical protein DRG20_00015 [Deltaproteobacteria bacterium]
MLFKGFKKNKKIRELPNCVILEITNRCNLKCIMCHFHSEQVKRKRAQGFMEKTLWQKILDEIGTWEKEVNVETFGVGEPLLHPDLIEIIKYGKKKPNIKIGFLTNGMLLTPSMSKKLLDAEIDWIGISIDGIDPKLFAHYRKGGTLTQVETNLNELLKIKKGMKNSKPLIKLNMVVLPGMENMVDPFINRWIDRVEEVMIAHYRPIPTRKFLDKPLNRTPCYLLYEMMVITWDGDMVLCCEDIFADEIIGNVKKKSLRSLWESKRFEEYRKKHEKGEFDKISICKDCDVWSTNQVKIENLRGGDIWVRNTPAQKIFFKIKNDTKLKSVQG